MRSNKDNTGPTHALMNAKSTFLDNNGRPTGLRRITNAIAGGLVLQLASLRKTQFQKAGHLVDIGQRLLPALGEHVERSWSGIGWRKKVSAVHPPVSLAQQKQCAQDVRKDGGRTRLTATKIDA